MNNTNGQSISDIPMDTNPGIKEKQLRSAEAFLDTASGIPDEMLNRGPQQETYQHAPQPDANPTPVERSRINSGLNLGPKYLEALSQLDVINNTKAISVQLPFNLKQVEMTAITGVEEQALKTASVNPESFLKKLNELIYTHTEFVGEVKPTFSDFLGSIYPPDKSALIWGLLSASYVVLPELERTCTSCGENYIMKNVPNDLIHEDTFTKIWDKEIGPESYTIQQSAFNGYITFEFGIPTEKERLMLSSIIHPESIKDSVSKDGNILSGVEMLAYFTKSITVGEPGDQTVLTDMLQDIYPFIKNLSPKVADGIKSSVDLSVFDEYMPNFYVDSICDHCGTSQKVEVDVEMTFFRKSLYI